MKIYESLISLAMSSNETDHELFHMYHSLEDKLDSLDWFFQEKVHSLPMGTYESERSGFLTEIYTNLIFERDVVEILPGFVYYSIKSPGTYFWNGEELIPINPLDNPMSKIKEYLTTLIENEHKQRHAEETDFCMLDENISNSHWDSELDADLPF